MSSDKIINEDNDVVITDIVEVCDLTKNENILEDTINTPTLNRYYQCTICKDNEFNVVSECGHFYCSKCARKLEDCAICRSILKGWRRVYPPFK
jgi:hypothetical protein